MKLRACTLLLAAYSGFTGTVQAAFYVNDDAPQPIALQPAVQRVSTSQTFDVPFYFRRAQLGPTGRRALDDMLLTAHRADVVTITGYGDSSGLTSLAGDRANTIRAWLIEHGVPATKIVATEESGVRAGSSPSVFNSTIVISTGVPTPAVSTDQRYAATLVPKSSTTPQPTLPVPASPTPPTISDQTKLAIANKLIALGQNKLIKPEDAVLLLAEFLKMQETSATPPAPTTPPPQPQIATFPPTVQQPLISPAPQAQVVPAAEAPRAWTLSSGKTLQENLTEWATQAGWDKPIWEATNPYQITFSSSMNGTFLDVLGQIAKAVPELDFQVWKGKRIFRVSDGKQ